MAFVFLISIRYSSKDCQGWMDPKFRFSYRNPYPIWSLRGRIDRGNLIEKGEIASVASQ